MASWLNLGGINFGLLGGTFDIAVKAFSAPFFLNAEVEKINDINYGGKVSLMEFTERVFQRIISWNRFPYPSPGTRVMAIPVREIAPSNLG